MVDGPPQGQDAGLWHRCISSRESWLSIRCVARSGSCSYLGARRVGRPRRVGRGWGCGQGSGVCVEGSSRRAGVVLWSPRMKARTASAVESWNGQSLQAGRRGPAAMDPVRMADAERDAGRPRSRRTGSGCAGLERADVRECYRPWRVLRPWSEGRPEPRFPSAHDSTIGWALMSDEGRSGVVWPGLWSNGTAATEMFADEGERFELGGAAPISGSDQGPGGTSPDRIRSTSRSELSSIRVISMPGWASVERPRGRRNKRGGRCTP